MRQSRRVQDIAYIERYTYDSTLLEKCKISAIQQEWAALLKFPEDEEQKEAHFLLIRSCDATIGWAAVRGTAEPSWAVLQNVGVKRLTRLRSRSAR